jgi:glycosyltransferase 2 family protein
VRWFASEWYIPYFIGLIYFMAIINRRIAVVLLRIFCVAAIFSLIFSKVSLPAIDDFKTPLFASAFALSVGLNVFQAALCTFRWRYIAKSISNPPAFGTSFWAYLEGCFFNQALPSFVGGDAVRVIRWRESGIPTVQAATSVLLDRVFGAIGAAGLASVACVLMWNRPVETYKILSTLALASVVLLGSVVFFFILHWSFVYTRLVRFPRVHSFLSTISKWSPSAWSASFLVLLGIFGQVLSGIAVYVLGRALSIDLPLSMLVSVTGIILLLSMIPISFAGWGVREAGFIALLAPLGVSNSQALALGICFGLSTLVGALPGGLSILLGFARR